MLLLIYIIESSNSTENLKKNIIRASNFGTCVPRCGLTCMEALCDGGGINEEATAQTTTDVWIELVERKLGLWGRERDANI